MVKEGDTERWWKCGLCDFEIRIPVASPHQLNSHSKQRIRHCLRQHGFKPDRMPQFDLVTNFRRNMGRRKAAEHSFAAMASRLQELRWDGLHNFAGKRRWVKSKWHVGSILVDDCSRCGATCEFSAVGRSVCWEHPMFDGIDPERRRGWLLKAGGCKPPLRERSKELAKLRKLHSLPRKKAVQTQAERIKAMTQRRGQKRGRGAVEQDDGGGAEQAPSWG